MSKKPYPNEKKSDNIYSLQFMDGQAVIAGYKDDLEYMIRKLREKLLDNLKDIETSKNYVQITFDKTNKDDTKIRIK